MGVAVEVGEGVLGDVLERLRPVLLPGADGVLIHSPLFSFRKTYYYTIRSGEQEWAMTFKDVPEDFVIDLDRSPLF